MKGAYTTASLRISQNNLTPTEVNYFTDAVLKGEVRT